MSYPFYWNEHKAFVFTTIADEINQHDLSYVLCDVTYLNDTCPSFEISISETQKHILFLPNSWRNDGEESNKYMLIRDEEYGCVEFYTQFDTLEQVIAHLINCNDKNITLL